MRILEVVLILANVSSLILSFKRQSKTTWLWAAGINLLIFLLHGILEGFRYQMLFSYLFVMALAVFTLIRMSRKSEMKSPQALKIIAVGLSLLSLMLSSLLSYALPVFTLPKPTGSYAVGVQYFHWIDEDRMDPFLEPSTKKRELMVKVYYPAKEDDLKPFSPYFHSPQLVGVFAEFYGMPDFTFAHLNLVRTNSREGLQLSENQLTYPVILFSHGAGTTMEVQTSQSEDLASHGYIVVNIDHTYVSAGTVFPDRTVSHKDATTNFDVAEPAEVITQIMADDASFVIDKLMEMNAGTIDSIFRGKLDLEKLGAMGHSVGGAVAYHLAINDSRVKAGIDLDGVVYITPEGDPKDVVPFLMLAGDKYHIQAIESRIPLMKRFEDMDELDQKITVDIHGSEEAYRQAYNRAQQNVIGLTEVLQSSGNLFTIEGSDHMKFTDIGLFIGVQRLRELMGIGGHTDPAECLEITEALTVAFFDRYLKGETQVTFEALVQKYPNLRRVELIMKN